MSSARGGRTMSRDGPCWWVSPCRSIVWRSSGSWDSSRLGMETDHYIHADRPGVYGIHHRTPVRQCHRALLWMSVPVPSLLHAVRCELDELTLSPLWLSLSSCSFGLGTHLAALFSFDLSLRSDTFVAPIYSLVIGRGQKGRLRMALRQARTYGEWRAIANELDERE